MPKKKATSKPAKETSRTKHVVLKKRTTAIFPGRTQVVPASSLPVVGRGKCSSIGNEIGDSGYYWCAMADGTIAATT